MAIEADGGGFNSEAFKMLNVALRLTKQRSRAAEETWAQIGALSNAAGRSYARPPPVIARAPPRDLGAISRDLTVVCVKWGSKYGTDYVAALRSSVARALSGVCGHRFACLTDDGAGLPADVEIIPLQPRPDWDGWWFKACLFDRASCLRGTILYLDLDTVRPSCC